MNKAVVVSPKLFLAGVADPRGQGLNILGMKLSFF